MVSEELKQQYLDDIANGDAFSVKEAAKRLHVSVWSVRAYIRGGQLEAMHHGREYVIPLTALKAYIVANVAAPDEPKRKAKVVGRPFTPKDGSKPIRVPEPTEETAHPDDEIMPDEVEEEIEDVEEPEPEESPRPTPSSFGFGGWQ